MMSETKLIPYSAKYKNSCTDLYEQAFPADERRPTDEWLLCINRSPLMKTYIITMGRDENFAGFITAWQFRNFTYVEHFAVLPALRGKGAGSQAFQLFLKHIAFGIIVLEVELPETDLARRRVAFYERMGLHILPYPYMQPPYAKDRCAIQLRIMSSMYDIPATNFEEMKNTIHREVYGVKC